MPALRPVPSDPLSAIRMPLPQSSSSASTRPRPRYFSLALAAALAAIAAVLLAGCGGTLTPTGKVDLRLHDATVSTSSVPQGGSFGVAFTVTNDGTATSPITSVRLSLEASVAKTSSLDREPLDLSWTTTAAGASATDGGTLAPDGHDMLKVKNATLVQDIEIPSLDAGAAHQVNVVSTLPAGLAPGTFTLRLHIDADAKVPQSDRSNDTLDLTLTITAPITSCTDPNEVVSFADPAIEAFVVARLKSIGDGTMTCGNVGQILQLNVSNKGVTSLDGVQHLTGVYLADLSQNAIVDLSPVAGMTALSILKLWENDIVNLAPLADLPLLESLSFDDNRVTDLTALATISTLQTLTLDHNEVTSLAPLAGLSDLSLLWASYNQIASSEPLASMTALKSVDMTNNAFTYLPSLADLAALTYLRVGGPGFDDASGAADLPNIEELAVVYAGLTTVEAFRGLTSLKKLILTDNLIVDFTPLENLTGLKYLSLDQNRLISLTPASTMTGLDELRVQNNKITDLAPLVANAGLAAGDWLWLKGNCFAATEGGTLVPPQSQHMATLQGRGINVNWTPVGSDAWCGR